LSANKQEQLEKKKKKKKKKAIHSEARMPCSQ